jgi:pSer/pThr/pTyr-binding forkhead associated (FHA) protein
LYQASIHSKIACDSWTFVSNRWVSRSSHATVSRHHVEFRLENGQFLLVDLDSLNSTYVNHEPIDSAVLVDGDEIQIGKFRLLFLTRPTTG